MKEARSTEEARAWFAEDLRVVSPVVNNPAIIDAFAKVPREHYLGRGPWRIRPRMLERPAYLSPTAEPHQIYHDVLVSIDSDRALNSGQPSLWAYSFDHLAIGLGGTILQVGAGVGYFTAILAELVTPGGRVIAYEIEENLAERSKANLRDYAHVKVIAGDATKAASLPSVDAIIVFAGATHVPEIWLSSLSQSGRIAIPITGEDGWGFMLSLERRGDTFAASSLGSCGFYHCGGARTSREAAAFKAAMRASAGKVPPLDQMHRGRPEKDDPCAWYVGDGFWISKA